MKKAISILIAGMLAFSILAGCGTSADNTKTVTTQAPATSQPTKAAEKANEPVTLTYLSAVIEYPKFNEQINQALHKTNPNITVQIDHIADNYEAVLKTKMASGNAPDIFSWQGYLAMKPFVDANQVLDITNDQFDTLLYKNFLDAGKYNGKQYGIPTNVQTMGLLYNKDAFKAAGVAAPPKTISELKTVIEQCKKAGITPFAPGYKEQWIDYGMFFFAQSPVVPDMMAWYNSMNAGTGTFKNDKMNQVFQVLDLAYTNSGDKPLSGDFANMCHMLGAKKAAMAIQGEWAYGEVVKMDPNVQLGMAGLPINENPDDATVLADVAEVLYISADSKNQDAAKSFVKWMVSKDGAEATCSIRKTGSPSTANPKIDLNSFAADGNQWVKDGKKTAIFSWDYWAPGIMDVVGKDMQAYFAKSMNMDQMIKDLDEQWKKTVTK